LTVAFGAAETLVVPVTVEYEIGVILFIQQCGSVSSLRQVYVGTTCLGTTDGTCSLGPARKGYGSSDEFGTLEKAKATC
jgi:hypothetical protein